MTSVLNVDSIAAKDGTSPVELTKQSAAKVWCNNEQNSTHDIAGSLNVSSVTDAAAGKSTINYTNSMSDAGFSAQGSGFDSAVYVTISINNLTTSNHNWQTNGVDCEGVFNTVHGDLA
jgi:hypothetical protein